MSCLLGETSGVQSVCLPGKTALGLTGYGKPKGKTVGTWNPLNLVWDVDDKARYTVPFEVLQIIFMFYVVAIMVSFYIHLVLLLGLVI